MNDTTVPNTMNFNMNHGQAMAKPIYIQRLEASLNIEPFMTYAQEMLAQPLTSSEDSDSDVNTDILAPDEKIMNGIVTSKCGNFKIIFNFIATFLFITEIPIFFFLAQIDKMTNYKSTIYHKLERTASGCRIFC